MAAEEGHSLATYTEVQPMNFPFGDVHWYSTAESSSIEVLVVLIPHFLVS